MTEVVVISGLSGSGKTLAAKAVEDLGYFSVDNLPVPLIPPFIDLLDRREGADSRAALVVDVRERVHLESLPRILEELRRRDGLHLKVFFFEASDDTLQRRFSASRRPHPLALEGAEGLAEAIAAERELLVPVRAQSDRVITTDELSPHDLRRMLKESLSEGPAERELHCSVVSFGFKYGFVRDADMVFDARFLDNPYFHAELREQSGRDSDVLEFLQALPDYREFVSRLTGLLEFVAPRFVHEGKSYLTVAVGCTGGRHRSVAIAEALSRFLKEKGFAVSTTHRDLGKDPAAGRAS